MEKKTSSESSFSGRNMCQTFYPNQGGISTNKNKSFKIKNALSVTKKPFPESFPFYVYFGDIRVNSGKRDPKTKSKQIPPNPKPNFKTC